MASPPRSLADDLRARGDEGLAQLLQARPDLLHPVPADLTALATRASSPASIAMALRGLDQLSLHVLLAAALAPDPFTTTDVMAAVVGPLSETVPRAQARARVRACVAQLRTMALLWGRERAQHLVGAARDLLVPADRGPRVAAIDPIVRGYVTDPESLRSAVSRAPRGARAALDRLLAGPLVGTVTDARRQADPQRSPVEWLLAHHLLVPLGTDRAVVPGEVAALLRGPDGSATPARGAPGRVAPVPARGAGDPVAAAQERLAPGEPVPRTWVDVAPVPLLVPPTPASEPVAAARVQAGAVGAVLDVLHALSALGASWAEAPPARLRTGGIAQRDLTRTARAVGVGEATATLLIEVGVAAGLLAADSHEELTVLPTPAFDTWLASGPAERHARLISAWLLMPRRASPSSGRPLDPAGLAPAIADLRREVLAALAREPGAWTDAEVLQALDWWAPRRAEPGRHDLAREVLAELRTLGLLVAGSLAPAGHALLDDDRAGVVAALAQGMPAQVDALVLQADLTAVVPGLPSPELGAFMRLVAEPESTGAASVYRLTADSIRRALDTGRTAADLLAELGRRGQVPQPLAYLVADVARRHASLRIGAAATYLRCDDAAVLAAILADPGTAGLGLVALSDSVLISEQAPEHVLDRLRQRGHHPVPEGGAGPPPGPRRARSRPAPEPAPSASPALAAAAVRAMRANDPGTGGRPARRGAPGQRSSPRTSGRASHPVAAASPAEVTAALRAAIAAESTVWIGYADPSGIAGDRRVEPLRLAGGYLTALDLRTETVQSFALARITGVQRA